jgi:hypothetical protein
MSDIIDVTSMSSDVCEPFDRDTYVAIVGSRLIVRNSLLAQNGPRTRYDRAQGTFQKRVWRISYLHHRRTGSWLPRTL